MDFTTRQHRFRRGALYAAAFALLVSLAMVFGAVLLARDYAQDRLERSARERVDQASALAALSVSESVDRIASSVRWTAHSSELVRAIRSGDDVTRQRLVLQVQQATTGARTAFIADPDAKLLDQYPPDRSVVGASFADRDWYRGAQRHSPYVSEAYHAAADGRPLVSTLAAPVRDAGATIAYLGVAVDAKQFGHTLVRASRESGSPELQVVDQSGTTIAGSIDAGTPAVRSSHAIPGTGWSLVAALPTSDAYSDLRHIRTAATVFAGVVSMLLLVLGISLFATTRTLFGQQLRDERREQAFELNDTIVQRLAVAHLALSVGRPDEALDSLDEALDAGRRMIGQLAEGRQSYVRNAPAHAGEQVPA
jgi:hypothetical protein